MTRAIRLVATDLDGTLLRPDQTISPRTDVVLRRVAALGVTIVLVTARPPRIACEMAARVGIAEAVICCNGALVCDPSGQTILRHSPIASDAAAQIITALRGAIPGVRFAAEIGLRYVREPAYRDDESPGAGEERRDVVLEDALAFSRGGLTKLIARHPDRTVEELALAVASLLGESASVTHSGGAFVEILAAGVHKASALAGLAAERGIAPAEVLAFGDMPNDLPMLAWAGRAIAVANAHPDVLAMVYEVTASNADDGVAVALERLLLGA